MPWHVFPLRPLRLRCQLPSRFDTQIKGRHQNVLTVSGLHDPRAQFFEFAGSAGELEWQGLTVSHAEDSDTSVRAN